MSCDPIDTQNTNYAGTTTPAVDPGESNQDSRRILTKMLDILEPYLVGIRDCPQDPAYEKIVSIYASILQAMLITPTKLDKPTTQPKEKAEKSEQIKQAGKNAADRLVTVKRNIAAYLSDGWRLEIHRRNGGEYACLRRGSNGKNRKRESLYIGVVTSAENRRKKG